MIITCSGCGKTIQTPPSAAGKRVKCPGCATILRVPEADTPATAIAPEPMPPPITVEPVGTEVTTSKPSSQAKRARPIEDDDEDDLPPIRRRRDLDDDDFDPRQMAGKQANSLANAAMVTGICAIVSATIGCACCGIISTPITGILGVVAIICGFMGKVPGSESQALTGIICGGVAVILALLGVGAGVFALGLMNFQMMNFNKG